MVISWIYLILAAIAEALFGIGLFHSRGFSVFWPSLLAVAGGLATAILLGIAMKQLPIGLAFVVWSGLAALGTAAYGMIALGEPRDTVRILCMVLILGGVGGLKYTSSH